MHTSVLEFVKWRILPAFTLDVGAQDINGSIRPLLMESDGYIGVDMASGNNVDIIALASQLPFADNTFDQVVSTEMLEHDTYPWLSVTEMARVCRVGGRVIITARGYDERGCYPLHDYPVDYWRYSIGAIQALFRWAGIATLECINDIHGGPGVFAVGTKLERNATSCP